MRYPSAPGTRRWQSPKPTRGFRHNIALTDEFARDFDMGLSQSTDVSEVEASRFVEGRGGYPWTDELWRASSRCTG